MDSYFDNITYTTSSGIPAKINISDIAKTMKEIGEPPQILVMDIKAVMSPLLTGNMIILSKDVGEALERAREAKGVV